MGRARECRVGRRRVTRMGVDANIRPMLRPHERRIRGQRIARLRHGGERRVLHRHALGRILGGRARLGDDQRHALAHEAHGVGGQGGMGRDEELGAVAAAQRNFVRIHRHGTVRNGPNAIVLGVRAGENGDHPRSRQRAADVDVDNAGVRVRRPDDVGVGLPGEVDVVGEPALAGDEPRVLAAADGLAEALRGLVSAVIEEGHVRPPVR